MTLPGLAPSPQTRPRPHEPDVSLEFAPLPSVTGFSPIGIQAPFASCIRVYGGAHIWLYANVSCVVF